MGKKTEDLNPQEWSFNLWSLSICSAGYKQILFVQVKMFVNEATMAE